MSLKARELWRFLFLALYRLELRAEGYCCEATASMWRTSDRVIKDAKLPSRLRDGTAPAGKLLALIPQARLTDLPGSTNRRPGSPFFDLGAPFLVSRKVALAERN